MTWLVAIDESGNLGSCSQYFVMSAIISKRVKDLNNVFKVIPQQRNESKFYNSTDIEIMNILEKLSFTDISIITIDVDKHDYTSNYYGKHGNALYREVLTELLEHVFEFVGPHDVNLFLDRSTFIGLKELRCIAYKKAKMFNSNLKRCEKATSHQNKCIQLADFVAGSFFSSLEYKNNKFKLIIDKKSIPASKY